MASNRRGLLPLLIKKTFSWIPLLFLWPVLMSCDLSQRGAVSPDFAAEINSASDFGFVDSEEVFSAVAKIDFMNQEGYYPVKAALIIKKPSHLRLELLPVFGTPDFILTVTPEKVNVFIPPRKEFYSGPPASFDLKKFLPWQIALEDMVMIFTGSPPALKEKNVSYRGYRENNLLRLEMRAPSGASQTLWAGENNQLLRLTRQDQKGQEAYAVEYSYHHDRDAIPEKITITMADGITSLTVRYSDVHVENAGDMSVFDLAVPDDVKLMTLE